MRRFLSNTKDATLFGVISHAPFGSPIFKFFKNILEYLVVFLSFNLKVDKAVNCE